MKQEVHEIAFKYVRKAFYGNKWLTMVSSLVVLEITARMDG